MCHAVYSSGKVLLPVAIELMDVNMVSVGHRPVIVAENKALLPAGTTMISTVALACCLVVPMGSRLFFLVPS